MGCTNQAGEDNRNVARMGLLLAGLPVEVPGVTVNRLCASGLEAVNQAARQIMLGEADLVLAGGVESMTRAPLAMAKPDRSFPRGNADRVRHDDRLAVREPAHGGAARHGLDGRDRRERRGALRHLARGSGRVRAGEPPPRAAPRRRRAASTTRSCPCPCRSRRASRSRFTPTRGRAPTRPWRSSRRLRPVFREGGTVTAGNSSQINDGAACVVLASPEARAGAGPRAAGAHRVELARPASTRACMGIGPVPAARKALAGARARRPRHRPRRAERGLRGAGARLRARARPRPRAAERERRRDRARPPARLLGRAAARHAGLGDAPPRRAARPRDHVHRRRAGPRDGGREPVGVDVAVRAPCRTALPWR